MRSPRFSPDGRKIAFLFLHEDRFALGVFDRATGESRLVLRGTDESLYWFEWKGNDRIIFGADYQGNESFFVGSTDLSGKKVIRIVETQGEYYLGGSMGGIVDELSLDPEHIVVGGLLLEPTSVPGAFSIPIGAEAAAAKVNVRNRGISVLYTYHDSENRCLKISTPLSVRLHCKVYRR